MKLSPSQDHALRWLKAREWSTARPADDEMPQVETLRSLRDHGLAEFQGGLGWRRTPAGTKHLIGVKR